MSWYTFARSDPMEDSSGTLPVWPTGDRGARTHSPVGGDRFPTLPRGRLLALVLAIRWRHRPVHVLAAPLATLAIWFLVHMGGGHVAGMDGVATVGFGAHGRAASARRLFL